MAGLWTTAEDLANGMIVMQKLLAGVSIPMWVFTASTSEHAKRCLERIGLTDAVAWRGVVDTRTCKLETKHSPSSFEAAMAADFDETEGRPELGHSQARRGVLAQVAWRSR